MNGKPVEEFFLLVRIAREPGQTDDEQAERWSARDCPQRLDQMECLAQPLAFRALGLRRLETDFCQGLSGFAMFRVDSLSGLQRRPPQNHPITLQQSRPKSEAIVGFPATLIDRHISLEGFVEAARPDLPVAPGLCAMIPFRLTSELPAIPPDGRPSRCSPGPAANLRPATEHASATTVALKKGRHRPRPIFAFEPVSGRSSVPPIRSGSPDFRPGMESASLIIRDDSPSLECWFSRLDLVVDHHLNHFIQAAHNVPVSSMDHAAALASRRCDSFHSQIE